jgi:hypothetical protein
MTLRHFRIDHAWSTDLRGWHAVRKRRNISATVVASVREERFLHRKSRFY